MQFATENDALAEALVQHEVDPSAVEVTPTYSKNPNLVGSQGQPWVLVRELTPDGNTIIEFEQHSNGRIFADDNTYELPHYHGPNGEHLTY